MRTLVVLLCLVAAAEQCTDSQGRTGTCGPISDCPHLFALIDGRRPTSEDFALLRSNKCGLNNRQILLCCGRDSPPTSGDPEDHRNRRTLEGNTACGIRFKDRIVGGTEVAIGEFPWVALLGYTQSPSADVTYECGGTLISSQYVLTAAHCVTDLPFGFQLTQVRLGEHDMSQLTDCRNESGTEVCNTPPIDYGIAKVMFHEEYNQPVKRMNDIALLRLDRPAELGPFVNYICLPFGIERTRDLTGANMTVAGFGRTGPERDAASSEVLLKVVVPGVPQDLCAEVIRNKGGSVGERQLCAGGVSGKDSCGGDSGGPLITFTRFGVHHLRGVVSFGANRCGSVDIPGVYARVSSYLNWILDRIEP